MVELLVAAIFGFAVGYIVREGISTFRRRKHAPFWIERSLIEGSSASSGARQERVSVQMLGAPWHTSAAFPEVTHARKSLASPMDYHHLRRQYEPADPRLLIIAESPPEPGLYFYDPTGRVGEPIFAAFMEQLGIKPTEKSDGLKEMQQKGWLLIDATYEPIDKKFKSSDPRRDAVLIRDYNFLKQDITAVSAGRQVAIILIKANVCRVLDPLLTADGFHVLNRGRKVYLPTKGNQGHFRRQFSEIVHAAHQVENNSDTPRSR